MKKNLRILGVALISAVLAFMLAGCGSTQTEEQSAEPVEAAEPEIVQLGTASDTSVALTMTNETGQDITGISVKDSAAEEFPAENLVTAAAPWTDGLEVQLNFEPVEDAVTYDFQVTLEDGTQYVMHDIDLVKMDQGSVKIADDLMYLEYMAGDEVASTLDAEKALVEAEEQSKAEAEAAAQAEAEAAAAAEEETEEYYDDSDYSSDYSYEDTSYDSGGSQSEDVCVDPVLR